MSGRRHVYAGSEGCRCAEGGGRSSDRLRRELELKNGISELFLAVEDGALYNSVLERIKGALESPHGLFGYLEEDGSLVAASLAAEESGRCLFPGEGFVIPAAVWRRSDGIWARSLREQEALIGNEDFAVPDGHLPIRRAMSVPIISRGTVIGILMVANRDCDYEADDLALLCALARHVAPILQAKLAEDLLRKRDESLQVSRLALDSALSAIAIADRKGTLTYVNPSFCRLWGLDDTAEAVGRPLWDFWRADRRNVGVLRLLREGKDWSGEQAAVDRRGRAFAMFVHASAVRDEQGRPVGMMASVLDVTDQKRAEEALQESEERYRAVAETAFTGIAVTDHSRRIIWSNPAFARLFGCDQDELVGRELESVIGPPPPSALADVLPAGGCETVLERRDGGELPVLISLAPLTAADGSTRGTLAVLVDLTEQKRAEEERLRLATVVEQATESIVITDRDGRIEYVNPAFERVTGYGRDEVLGANPRLLKSGRHDRAFYQDMWTRLRRGEVWRGRLTNRRRDGALFLEEASIGPVRDASGRTTHYVAVKRDITRESELENALRHAQKMEAIGTLAGGIAHDFNNILYAILGFTRLAMKDLDPGSPAYGNLEQVVLGGRRAADLVRQILTFSRQDAQEYSNLRLDELVAEGVTLVRSTLPATIEVALSVERPAGCVHGDPTQIHQVLMNLCTNAYYAMRDGGGRLAIDLRTVRVGPGEAGSVPDLPPGEYVRLEVADTGHGMDPETMQHIFEPYFTTRELGDGTGLGLSTVHGILQAHEGAVTVESAPGAGATFRVYLPLVRATGAVEAPPPPPPHGDPPPARVLFVDDEETIARLAVTCLERAGLAVEAHTSSLEALRAFRRDPGRWDVVVTDMTMPDLTGLALAREILAGRPELPVILCTGYSHGIDRETALASGIREFLMKPIGMDELSDLIGRLVTSPQPAV